MLSIGNSPVPLPDWRMHKRLPEDGAGLGIASEKIQAWDAAAGLLVVTAVFGNAAMATVLCQSQRVGSQGIRRKLGRLRRGNGPRPGPPPQALPRLSFPL